MIILDYRFIAEKIPDTLRRQEKRVDWLYLTIKAIKNMQNEFINEFEYFKILASHNYQILSLEHLLNTLLIPSDDIYITDGLWYENTYLYYNGDLTAIDTFLFFNSEEIEPYFYDTYIYFNSEFDIDQYDFIINVPISHQSDLDFINKLNNLVKLYLLAGKNYIVNYY